MATVKRSPCQTELLLSLNLPGTPTVTAVVRTVWLPAASVSVRVTGNRPARVYCLPYAVQVTGNVVVVPSPQFTTRLTAAAPRSSPTAPSVNRVRWPTHSEYRLSRNEPVGLVVSGGVVGGVVVGTVVGAVVVGWVVGAVVV